MSTFRQSIAFIVGINAYENGISPLVTARNDAVAMHDALAERHGYEPIHLLLDGAATLDGLREVLDNLPSLVQRESRFLFYFAGHGIALDNEDEPAGYLVPQDADANDMTTMLPMGELHQVLMSLKCRHMLAILDCCFAGAFRWSGTRNLRVIPGPLYQERFARYTRSQAWQVLTSTAHDQKAKDLIAEQYLTGRRENGDVSSLSRSNSQELTGANIYTPNMPNTTNDSTNNTVMLHSPFAAALLSALRDGEGDLPAPDGDGVITATELYFYLRQQVEVEEFHYDQTPGLWPLPKHDKGEYIFEFPERFKDLPTAPELYADNNPYLGLSPYTREHESLFFGRQQLIQQLCARVTGVTNVARNDAGATPTQPLTHVLGVSGSGKSSLVMAGLLPALEQFNNEAWQILGPIRPGYNPLSTLSHELSTALTGEPNDDQSQSLVQVEEREPTSEQVRTDLTRFMCQDSCTRVLLVLDQLEELFTLCNDDDKRTMFLKILAWALEEFTGQLHIVTTLRSDFEPQLQKAVLDVGLPTLHTPQTRFVVTPMSQNELREVIEEPASVRVLYFEPDSLVDDLINEVVQMPGALPLLSFTLSELYLKYLDSGRGDRTLTQVDYDELGGVLGSLRHRANELYNQLSQDGLADELENVMLRMVSIEAGELARRRVTEAELNFADDVQNRDMQSVLDALVENRLIVTDLDATGTRFYEPAHDELIRGWPRLTNWIRDFGEGPGQDLAPAIIQQPETVQPENKQLVPDATQQITLQYQRRLWEAAKIWDQRADELPPETLWQRVGASAHEFISQYIPLEPPQNRGYLWDDPAQSATLETLLDSTESGSISWLNGLEKTFARESTERARGNRKLRHRIVRSLTGLLLAALVAAILAILNLQAANENLGQKLQEESGRFSNSLTDQLTEDPVASLHLGILALPAENEPRPYVPEAEGGLSRAILTSLERGFVHVSDAPLTTARDKFARVDFGDEWIAVGGSHLNLVDYAIGVTQTLTGPFESEVDVKWIDQDRLLSVADDTVQIWEEGNLIQEQSMEDTISCIAVDPSAQMIAICVHEQLWMWSLPNDELIKFTNLPGGVAGLAWSADGQLLATWDNGNTLRVIRVVDGVVLPLLIPAEAGAVYDAAWSLDGRFLIASHKPNIIRLYDIETMQMDASHEIEVGIGHVQAISETNFLVWSVNGRVRMWTVESRNDDGITHSITEYGTDKSTVTDVALLENDSLVLMRADNVVELYPSLTITQPTEFAGHTQKVLSADLRSGYLATSSVDGSVRIWDVATRQELLALAGHTSHNFEERSDVVGVRWQDDQHVLSYGEDGTVRRWRIFDDKGDPLCHGRDPAGIPICFGADSALTGHQGNIFSIEWRADDRFVTLARDGSAGKWDLSTQTSQIYTNPFGSTVVWSPDTTQILVYVEEELVVPDSDDDNSVFDGVIYDFDSGAATGRIQGPITTAYWLGAGILTSNLSGTVQLVEPVTGDIIRKFDNYQRRVTAVAEHENGIIATGEFNGAIRVWSPSNGEPATVINGELALPEQYPIQQLEWSKDGERLLSVGRQILLWDIATQSSPWERINTGFVQNKAGLSPDGQRVAFAIDTTFGLLDAADGSIVWSDENSHDQPVLGVAWVNSQEWANQEFTSWSGEFWRNRLLAPSTARMLLLTWSGDGTARLWDLRNDQPVEIMRMTELGDLTTAAINPSGSTIATAAFTFAPEGPVGILHTWQTWHQNHAALLNRANELTTRSLSVEQQKALIGR